jgi:SAM-dependent methyltransferase
MIDAFNTKQNLELEARTTISIENFDRLVKHYANETIKITQTLNSITKIDANSIIETRYFMDGKQLADKQTYTIKSRLQQINKSTSRDCKIILSSETMCEKERFIENNNTIYRFKWRYTIILDDWNIDITFVKEEKSKTKLKDIKSAMFRKSKLEEKPEIYERIELELERVTKPMVVTDLEIIDKVFSLLDDRDEYDTIMKELGNILMPDRKSYKPITIKNMTNQSRDLTKNKLSEIRETLGEYYITDKADGEHALVYFSSVRVSVLTSKMQDFPAINLLTNTVIEGELVEKNIYAFDILIHEGKDLRNNTLTERYDILKSVVKSINKDKAGLGLPIDAKYMVKLGDKIEKVAKEYAQYVKKLPYETDGYILTHDGGYYDMCYKLKYLSHTSIDFLVMKAPKNIIGIEPYGVKKNHELYFLFVGIGYGDFNRFNITKITNYNTIFSGKNIQNDYFTIQFCPSSDPFAYIYWHPTTADSKNLDFTVCEFVRDVEKKEWKILREREDRMLDLASGNYYGNNFAIAENVWQSFTNPIELADLYTMDKGYFKVYDNPIYTGVRRFNNYAKGLIMREGIAKLKKQFPHEKLTAIDLAAGKGQDISRLINTFDHTLFIDIDASALQELVSRKLEKPRNKMQPNKMTFSVLEADLNRDYKEILGLTSRFVKKAHYIVCNLAIHYLINTAEGIENFTRLISELLYPGGIFVYTAFNGEIIFNMLKTDNWEVRNGDRLKYSIVKKYRESQLGIGQKIDVILPFSNGEYYEESLVNYKVVNNKFEQYGFSKPTIIPFDACLDNYKERADLGQDDIKFASLYMGVILSFDENKSTKK